MLISWVHRHSRWEKYGSEIISLVPCIPGRTVLWTRSAEVARQLVANKSDLDKIPEQVSTLGYINSATVGMGADTCGESVFSSYRDRWPRHTRIVSPGFNNKLYEQVWNESLRTYYEMIQTESWPVEPGISCTSPDAIAMTSKIALYLIASCGFGMTLSWEETVGERICGMTLPECFHIASASMIPQLFFPKRMFHLPIRAKIYESNLVIESILLRIIENRRRQGPTFEQKESRKDVFSLLLTANEAEADSNMALTDTELVSNIFLLMLAGHETTKLISNVFLLLVAGHETTSHALASSLGLLACHPDVQEKAFQEIVSIVPDGRDPTYNESESLRYVQACFLEGIRIFPSVAGLPRCATVDTSLQVPDGADRKDIFIKKGQYMVLDLFAISYNSAYYPNPDQYIPERWLDPNTEPGINFSTGPRVCVGKKFALTEGTAILAMIIRDWKIEPMLKDGESLQEWRLRCLDNSVANSLGFGPTSFPLRFRRRI
ncbi:cytochrome P450 [Dacryopinax primogenitus]|uniref:Cytochrome P450 n=1 Tax=Dacryopinax primogenitus (strain DJM 731) TaxID=1858805 RepID=M5G4H5_DACPD|nr:cytochrome P450 [Dacryopinax primogenitus]EJT98642.1 cytochrome P450 [Dacryopinax primogenitus]